MNKKPLLFLGLAICVIALVYLIGLVNMSYFSGAQLVTQNTIKPVMLNPTAGSHTISSTNEPLLVSMSTLFGGTIYFTRDGSSPVNSSTRWLALNNPSLEIYQGYAIEISKTTTLKVVLVSPVGTLTPIQSELYRIAIDPDLKKDEDVVNFDAPEPVAKEYRYAMPQARPSSIAKRQIDMTLNTTLKKSAPVVTKKPELSVYQQKAQVWNSTKGTQKSLLRKRQYGDR